MLMELVENENRKTVQKHFDKHVKIALTTENTDTNYAWVFLGAVKMHKLLSFFFRKFWYLLRRGFDTKLKTGNSYKLMKRHSGHELSLQLHGLEIKSSESQKEHEVNSWRYEHRIKC